MKLGRIVHALAEVLIGAFVLRDSAMLGNEVKNGPAKDYDRLFINIKSTTVAVLNRPFHADRDNTARVNNMVQ